MWTNNTRYVIIKSREVITLSSVTDYQFKKFQNTTRTFSSEEKFNLGMNYTDSPIEPGQSKMLVNFDISNDGYSLKPRAGIKPDTVAFIAKTANTNAINNFLSSSTSAIICAVGDHIFNNQLYRYAVLLDLDTKKTIISTISNNIESNAKDTDKFKVEGMAISDTCLYSDYINHFGTKIHDETMGSSEDTSKKYTTQHVGTKAWNGAYCFFGKTDVNKKSELYTTAFDESSKRFYFKKINPTALTALEASPNKFNMLLDNPYSFQNNIVAGAFVLQGVLCYDSNNTLVVSPKIKTKYNYKLAYTAPSATYTVKWEWKDFNGTSWTTIKEEQISISDKAIDITCEFAAPIKDSLMRVSVTQGSNTYPDQVLAIAINCDAETQSSSANSELKKYDLSKASGMCYWQNRLVLWGFSNDNIIIASETNLPEWFPYPNNIDLFEEPVIHCEPYLDALLVFTTQKLYKLTMLADGTGWTKTCIQEHLHLTQFDTNLIQTIKNMVFFKSGNSYFMVVPSSANTTTGLTIAPISKPIQWLLDNFKGTVTEIIKDMYNSTEVLQLEYCFNYINNSDLIINYVFKSNSNLLNFCLIYDTEARTWRTHLFESQGLLKMYKSDATKDGTLISLISGFVKVQNSYTGETLIPKSPVIQFFKRTPNEPDDYYLLDSYNTDTPDIMDEQFYIEHTYKNYQFLDTGYRALGEVNTKKRHREFQLRFNNKSEKPLHFGTTFYIDGEDRKNMYRYEIQHDTDPTSDNYGVISVVPKLETNVEVAGTTLLYDVENNINSWTLNVSQFPQVPLIKARVAVSGKGYHNKLKLLSINELNYELLGLCWVFKYKNLR